MIMNSVEFCQLFELFPEMPVHYISGCTALLISNELFHASMVSLFNQKGFKTLRLFKITDLDFLGAEIITI